MVISYHTTDMTGHTKRTRIVFSHLPSGWFGTFDHFGVTEDARGANLDDLISQLAEWLEVWGNSADMYRPRVVAFGCPVRVQELDVMRARIEHEWVMEAESYGARS